MSVPVVNDQTAFGLFGPAARGIETARDRTSPEDLPKLFLRGGLRGRPDAALGLVRASG